MAAEPPLRWRVTPENKSRVIGAILEALYKIGATKIVEIRDERRSDAQNRLMWPLLTDIADQVLWGHPARHLSPAQWKVGMMLGLHNHEYVPGVNGGVFPLAELGSSALSKADFSMLIELIYSFGAERGVRFRTDKATTIQRAREAGLYDDDHPRADADDVPAVSGDD